MNEVKEQHITNDKVRKKFFDITNIKKQIATRQLTFIIQVARNSDDHIPTKVFTTWCKQKRRSIGAVHMNKKSIAHDLHIIIPGVYKTGALNTWAHFDLNKNDGGI